MFRTELTLVFLLCIAVAPVVAQLPDEKLDAGQKIYLAKCATCHGVKGQGSDHYDEVLGGDQSHQNLLEYIVETMPEDDPDSCVGDEAKLVTDYLFERFYSIDARTRNAATKIQLSRLTARQYKESIADIFSVFQPPPQVGDQRGLEAKYFKTRSQRKDNLILSRVDPVLNFDFGSESSHPDAPAEEFSMNWRGSIVPPESGNFEITVESNNGFRLWLNDRETPLIDRHVSSDGRDMHSVNIYLLGGRPVPLEIDFFKYKDKTAKFKLMWKRPHGVKALIPHSSLIPKMAREVAIVSTPFPADDSSTGYPRGISISKQWDEATTQGAVETANWIVQRVEKYAKTRKDAADREDKIKDFCKQFVELALQQTMNEQVEDAYINSHFSQEISLADKVKRCVIMSLKSPRFLYPTLRESKNRETLRARIALYTWDSVPDRSLIKRDRKGQLRKSNQVKSEITRMLRDPRGKQKLTGFFNFWLQTDHAKEATKDQERFPKFDQHLLSDLQTSLELFLDELTENESIRFPDLFQADHLYVNKRLAEFYNLDVEPTSFEKHDVEKGNRAGLLTHPYLMSGFAYHKESSPIHRGVFVAKKLLGRTLRQPPDAVQPLGEEFDPTLTTRQRVEHQTKDTACMNCHRVINPLGFSLENFDAVGRFRTNDKDKKIDSSAEYEDRHGERIRFNGAKDLANFLIESPDAQKNFIRQLFNHYIKQPIEAFGPGQLDELHQKFVANDYNIRSLLVDMIFMASTDRIRLDDVRDSTP